METKKTKLKQKKNSTIIIFLIILIVLFIGLGAGLGVTLDKLKKEEKLVNKYAELNCLLTNETSIPILKKCMENDKKVVKKYTSVI